MPTEPTTDDRPLEIARLERRMEQADAEWEQLTQSIDADKELLAVLRRQVEHCHIVLAMQGERALGSPSTLADQVATLERQMERLERHLALENLRRSVLMKQFEGARLALATIRRSAVDTQRSAAQRLASLLRRCLLLVWHEVWSMLEETGDFYMRVHREDFR